MLHSAYSEQPQWTPSRLIRTVVITLISGVVAGAVLMEFVGMESTLIHDQTLGGCIDAC